MNRAAVLCGLGAWVPPTVVTNDDLATRLDVSDEWIRSRTGIGQRRLIDPGSATSDLAVEAGERAMKSAGTTTCDMVLLATTTPDHPVPGTAPAVAARLGQTGVAAVDVNAACSGFVYGLATAAAFITASIADRVLLIGADAFSTVVDPGDRTTAPLFGDGAGAVMLRAGSPDEPGALSAFDLGSEGDRADLIMQKSGGSRQRSTALEPADADRWVTMNGQAVFRSAIECMTESSRTVLRKAGQSIADVSWVAAHQANSRILSAVAKKLEFPAERMLMNVDRVGNTSAASIPLVLEDAVRAGTLTAGQLVLITAFGAGLTWGSTLVRWPDLTVD